MSPLACRSVFNPERDTLGYEPYEPLEEHVTGCLSIRISRDPTLAAEGLSHTKLDGEVGLELRVYF